MCRVIKIIGDVSCNIWMHVERNSFRRGSGNCIYLKISLRQFRSSLASWQSILWSQKKFLLIQTPLSQGSWPSGHSAKTNQLRWMASKGGRGHETIWYEDDPLYVWTVRSDNVHICVITIVRGRAILAGSRQVIRRGREEYPRYESAGKKLRTASACVQVYSPRPRTRKLDARGWPSAFDNYRSIKSPTRGASSCDGRRAIRVRRSGLVK